MKIAGYSARIYEKSIVICGRTIFYGRKPIQADINVITDLLREAKRDGRNEVRKSFKALIEEE